MGDEFETDTDDLLLEDDDLESDLGDELSLDDADFGDDDDVGFDLDDRYDE